MNSSQHNGRIASAYVPDHTNNHDYCKHDDYNNPDLTTITILRNHPNDNLASFQQTK